MRGEKKTETGGKKHLAWENYDVILVRTHILFIVHLIYLRNIMYTLNLFLDYVCLRVLGMKNFFNIIVNIDVYASNKQTRGSTLFYHLSKETARKLWICSPTFAKQNIKSDHGERMTKKTFNQFK